MERKKVIISSVVGFLGLLSACMAFAAQAKRIKPTPIHATDHILTCSNALPVGLAIGAAAATVLAQIVFSAATGFFCIGRGSYRPNMKWGVGLICFILTWVTFANGLRLLILGAIEMGDVKTEHPQDSDYTITVYCLIHSVTNGYLIGGGILSLVTMVLEVVGYLAWDSSAETTSDNPWAAGGNVAMGRPKYPSTEYPQPQP